MEPNGKSDNPSAEEIVLRLSRAAQLCDRVKGLVRDLRTRDPGEAVTSGGGDPQPAEPASTREGAQEQDCPPAVTAGAFPPHAPALSPSSPDDSDLSLQIFVTRQNIVRLASLADSPMHDLHQISRLLNGEILHLCQLLGQEDETALHHLPGEEARPNGQQPSPS